MTIGCSRSRTAATSAALLATPMFLFEACALAAPDSEDMGGVRAKRRGLARERQCLRKTPQRDRRQADQAARTQSFGNCRCSAAIAGSTHVEASTW